MSCCSRRAIDHEGLGDTSYDERHCRVNRGRFLFFWEVFSESRRTRVIFGGCAEEVVEI